MYLKSIFCTKFFIVFILH